MSLEQQVKQFNSAYGIEEAEKPKLPSDREANLCHQLILDGLIQLNDAFDNQDTKEIATAFTFLLYTTAEQAVHLGYPITELLREAHKSHMDDAIFNCTDILMERLNEH